MTDSNNLEGRLRIQTPCPKTWGAHEGDEKKRFCEQCDLHVHNAEAMTRAEAEGLSRESSERVCMRMVFDGRGMPVYRDSTPVAARGFRRLARLTLAAGAALLAACRGELAPPVPVDPATGVVTEVPTAQLGRVCPEAALGRQLTSLGYVAYEPASDHREVLGEIEAGPGAEPNQAEPNQD